MNNDYVTALLVRQRLDDLRHEADQERLADLVRGPRSARRPWWHRLLPGRSAAGRAPRPTSGRSGHRPTPRPAL